MNYEEASKLAGLWTTDHDISLGGWRSVIKVLHNHNARLEGRIDALTEANRRLRSEVDRLALDLGIVNRDFVLPPQPHLVEVAKMVKEIDKE